MPRRVTIGVSFKMYFSHDEAARWMRRVADMVRDYPAVAYNDIEMFVCPTYLQIPDALMTFAGTGVAVGAQDVATEDSGPFTGEVSATELNEMGVLYAEVGHAERRRLFGETDAIVARKVAAAVRHNVVPVICIGEPERMPAADAATAAIAQLQASLAAIPADQWWPVCVAYEPVWAIGAAEPAPVDHIRTVTQALRDAVALMRPASRVIYGGSAGPGLLTEPGDAVDGLFLGRFAHDPDALGQVLHEASTLAARWKTTK